MRWGAISLQDAHPQGTDASDFIRGVTTDPCRRQRKCRVQRWGAQEAKARFKARPFDSSVLLSSIPFPRCTAAVYCTQWRWNPQRLFSYLLLLPRTWCLAMQAADTCHHCAWQAEQEAGLLASGFHSLFTCDLDDCVPIPLASVPASWSPHPEAIPHPFPHHWFPRVGAAVIEVSMPVSGTSKYSLANEVHRLAVIRQSHRTSILSVTPASTPFSLQRSPGWVPVKYNRRLAQACVQYPNLEVLCFHPHPTVPFLSSLLFLFPLLSKVTFLYPIIFFFSLV